MTSTVIVADITAVTFAVHNTWEHPEAVDIIDGCGALLLSAPAHVTSGRRQREALLAAADHASNCGVLRGDPFTRTRHSIPVWWYVPATCAVKCGPSYTNDPIATFTNGLLLPERGWEYSMWDAPTGTLTCGADTAIARYPHVEEVERALATLSTTG